MDRNYIKMGVLRLVKTSRFSWNTGGTSEEFFVRARKDDFEKGPRIRYAHGRGAPYQAHENSASVRRFLLLLTLQKVADASFGWMIGASIGLSCLQSAAFERSVLIRWSSVRWLKMLKWNKSSISPDT
jgi:hypothetical protein